MANATMMLGARALLLRRVLATFAVVQLVMEPGVGAQPQTAPDTREYTALVSQYRRGDFQGAMVSLATWPPQRVRAVARVSASPQDLDLRQARAAVMLHSDVSMLVAAVDPRLSKEHIDVAAAWIRLLPNITEARFKERWQAYAVGPHLVQHDLRQAALAVRQGIAAFPRGADLQLMRGTLLELTARSETSDFRGVWRTPKTSDPDFMDRRPIARIEGGLVDAALAYRRALELDATLLSARLRLGWAYDVNNSSDHAREQLRIVADGAASREQRYLAHLILGGLAEQEGQLDLAYQEYDTAHTIQTSAQTAHIALMRAAQMVGNTGRAQRLFAEYMAVSSWGEDPWWSFSMGLDSELSAWLHQQASQP